MTTISPDTYNRLRKALLECGEFNSDDNLRTYFSDSRLRAWRYYLPQANNITSRVELLIDFLQNKQQSDTQINALILFVQVLSERIAPADFCHVRLVELADELTGAFSNNSSQTEEIETELLRPDEPLKILVFTQKEIFGPQKQRLIFRQVSKTKNLHMKLYFLSC